jgi:tetratricopeptide (TPR) repeat protein
MLQESQGNWQAAQPNYQKVLDIQSTNALAANNLAYSMLEHGGNVDVALSLAQTARRGLPDLASTADTLAWAYIQKGTYQQAADMLEDALKKSPQDQAIEYHLGIAYQKMHDVGRAKLHLQHALQMNPKSSLADPIRQALVGLNT